MLRSVYTSFVDAVLRPGGGALSAECHAEQADDDVQAALHGDGSQRAASWSGRCSRVAAPPGTPGPGLSSRGGMPAAV